jgi:biopolymer transport protein ExbB
LLGLLGTVMGMIATFKLISSSGSGDPKLLAAGISEALIATATGMSVAIPSLLFHAFLSRKAKGIIGSMEQTAVGFINGVPEERPAFA